MGHKKRQRKKYVTPGHPWEGERIEREKEFLKKYGLKNKEEIWKMESVLRRFKKQAKNLIAGVTEQAEKEKKEMIDKLVRLGLVNAGAKIDDVLDLKPEEICERRLQTVVLKKGLAKTITQARQFIVHGHISLDGKKTDSPSRLVLKEEEGKIGFLGRSNLSKADHPERKVDQDLKQKIVIKKEAEEAEEKAEKKLKDATTKTGKKTAAKA